MEVAPSVVAAVASVLVEMGATPDADADALFDRGAHDLDEPLLGIVVARRVPIGAYGLLEYGLRASATVGDALSRLARFYASVTSRVRAEVAVVGGHTALVFHRAPNVAHSRHWIEMAAAAIAGRIAEGAGRPSVLHAVQFLHAHPDPSLHDRWVDALGAPVTFGARKDALVFVDGALARPMSTGESRIATSVDVELRALAESQYAFPDAQQLRLRAAILERLTDGVTLLSVARALRIAPRTLQRSIAQRGSSWSQELDETRRARALELLAAGGKTSEIADALGFRDPSAFFRAFRRWTGTTPRDYRP